MSEYTKVKISHMKPEEIKRRYGAPGELAEDRDAERWQVDNDLYDHKAETIRRMAKGKRRML